MNKIYYYRLAMSSKFLLLFVWYFMSFSWCFAQDAIICRDGRIKEVKIIQTNNNKTLYRESNTKNATEESIDNTKLFMLKFKTRGNIVFNSKGERILSTSEPVQIPRDAIVVYYKDGREVSCFNLTMDANTICYRTGKKGKGLVKTSDKSEVFMVRYPDGTRDILTDLAAEEEREQKEVEERNKAIQEAARQDSIANAEEESSAINPKKATIVTQKGYRMKVWICSDANGTVSYKKVNMPKAAIFRMSRSKIKNIIY